MSWRERDIESPELGCIVVAALAAMGGMLVVYASYYLWQLVAWVIR